MSKPSTVIIGGGLAGLAAATALAARDCPVTLLESRPRLGGRATSFEDPATGELIDNCQHVAMGCCTNFSSFCQSIGIEQEFRTEKSLFFVSPSGRVIPFRAGRLPAPLHLAGSILRIDYLRWRDKFQLLRQLSELARLGPRIGQEKATTLPPRSRIPVSRRFESQPSGNLPGSIGAWLDERHVSHELRQRFWHLFLVSALSESLDRICLSQARKVLVDGFLSHRDAWQVQIPRRPLAELYGTVVTDWLSQRGATVRLSTGVSSVRTTDDGNFRVDLRSREHLTADQIILAVPSHQVRPLLSETLFEAITEGSSMKPDTTPPEELPIWADGGFPVAPISSVHLWLDQPLCELPHAVFVDRLSQWMFNRTVLQAEPRPRRWYYQVVISDSRMLQNIDQSEIIATVLGELQETWPARNGKAGLLHGRVVTEHSAVFSPQPGIDTFRPPQSTGYPGLFLAGDWTATGWPATMEGAVRSGYLAAEGVMDHLGKSERILVDDLLPQRIPRWLYRL